MQIDENRLMEVFATCWEEEKEIDEIRESVKNSLESFCEECEAPKKIINAAYAHYKKVASLVNVVLKMYPFIGGYCYTQLTDVELEQNGLYYYDRRPKFDIQKLRDIFGKQPEKAGKNEME